MDWSFFSISISPSAFEKSLDRIQLLATEVFSVRPTITAGDANLLPISDSIRKKGDAAVMLSKAVDNARLCRGKSPQVEPVA